MTLTQLAAGGEVSLETKGGSDRVSLTGVSALLLESRLTRMLWLVLIA